MQVPLLLNRSLQRCLLLDVGQKLHKADSLIHLLTALSQCIMGHRQLFSAGILHRDISISNVLFNTDRSDPERLGFLIDLDNAVRTSRMEPSDRVSMTGTALFMSCGVLLAFLTSYYLEDDLESFFWVLLWICVSYKELGAKACYYPGWSVNTGMERHLHVQSRYAGRYRRLSSFHEDSALFQAAPRASEALEKALLGEFQCPKHNREE